MLWGTLGAEGWLELLPIQLVRFDDIGLPHDSSDRIVWHFVQRNHMILLTDNRNMADQDSLEQTIREENDARSFPVITIGNVSRITERTYRERCAARLVEIVLDLNDFLGAGRLFIP